ncbi:hypothetical protein GOV04_03590 [Candidatus Woesearchaeota archaeon]|nr:hypothetical protein [Candidatus Woesearchaeota archaeon]
MKCKKCNRHTTVKLSHATFCTSCFNKIIESRTRKTIRLNKLINKRKNIVYYDDSKKAKVLLYILEKTFKNQPFIFKKTNKLTKGVLLAWSTDDENKYFLEQLTTKNKYKLLGHNHYKKPLLNITDQELLAYAKIKNITAKKTKKESTAQEKFLDFVEAKHPGSKFALLNSTKKLKAILK